MWPEYFIPVKAIVPPPASLECLETLFKVPEPKLKQQDALEAVANEIERQWLCVIFAFKSKGDCRQCTILTKVRDETVLQRIKDDLNRRNIEMSMEDNVVTVKW